MSRFCCCAYCDEQSMMHAPFENNCGTTRTKQFLPLQAVWALGQRWAPTQQDSQATSDSLTDWSLDKSQPTGHEIRKMDSNSQVRWTLGTGQLPKRIVTWRWHKVRRLVSDKITRKITGSKQLRWMAASEQLRRAPKVSTAPRHFSTTITIFPPTSLFKRISCSFTFRALLIDRPITIASFCRAEKFF